MGLTPGSLTPPLSAAPPRCPGCCSAARSCAGPQSRSQPRSWPAPALYWSPPPPTAPCWPGGCAGAPGLRVSAWGPVASRVVYRHRGARGGRSQDAWVLVGVGRRCLDTWVLTPASPPGPCPWMGTLGAAVQRAPPELQEDVATGSGEDPGIRDNPRPCPAPALEHNPGVRAVTPDPTPVPQTPRRPCPACSCLVSRQILGGCILHGTDPGTGALNLLGGVGLILVGGNRSWAWML